MYLFKTNYCRVRSNMSYSDYITDSQNMFQAERLTPNHPIRINCVVTCGSPINVF